MTRVRLIGVWAALLFAGCASFPQNPPLRQVDPSTGYRFENLVDAPNADETFVILSFSGGGTRAAALAYGVLEYLRDTRIDDGQRSLLDDVDVISSVSGGSFTAAYYGLFGKDKFFRDFRHAVLARKIQRDLILRVLAPWNWPWLVSPWYGRSDLTDDYYDTHIFGGHTFADMPRHRPFIILNSTDMTLGAQFSFIQDHFDRLCSNLDGVHVSRAVTASSAFPVAFTPLTLENYPKATCHYVDPVWVTEALKDFQLNPPRYQRARTWTLYDDASRRPYIHVNDGGLADNIGLRGPEVALSSNDSSWSLLNKANYGQVKRIAVIIVDAKPAKSTSNDQGARPPSILSVLSASASNPMENYSSDTVELLRKVFEEWDTAARNFDRRQQAMRQRCGALAQQICGAAAGCVTQRQQQCAAAFVAPDTDRPQHPTLYEVHVQFDALAKHPHLRDELNRIPTTLQLPDHDVQELIDGAKLLLKESDQYNALVRDLGGSVPN